MKREDIEHLATLSRLTLTEQELQDLESELSSIMSYVSVITDIASEEADGIPKVGARHNIFRDDVVTNQGNEHTTNLLAEMPHTDGRYMKVKKILSASK